MQPNITSVRSENYWWGKAEDRGQRADGFVGFRASTQPTKDNKFDWEVFRSEKPQHKVTVQPFFMGKFLITQAQWQAIASRTDLKIKRDLEPNPFSLTESCGTGILPV